MNFKIKLADLTIDVQSQYPALYDFCEKYRSEDEGSAFLVSISPREIAEERKIMPDPEFSESYLEECAALRKIGDRLPLYNRFLIHGAAITFEDRAYLFTAPSGTGKSSHILMWKKYLGEKVDIVNGDKCILSVAEDEIYVHSTPWAGKEKWNRNRKAKLGGICILRRGRENMISRRKPGEILPELVEQIFWPKQAEAAGRTLELLDSLVNLVPVYLLECDRSEDAVRRSFEALTGYRYEGKETKI